MAYGILGTMAGILLLLVGLYMIFMLPMSHEHQDDAMIWTGIVMGAILVVIAGFLIFF
ncbi:MAG: hypothetical protein HY519_02855 [Candidatus Aenigmarchaeota archaeon]|nr:hypothetical protein [Candidatus Aenigmarchaeota archaeon]